MGVFKGTWTDLHQIWMGHYPLIGTHQVQKDSDILLRFERRAEAMRVWVENRGYFCSLTRRQSCRIFLKDHSQNLPSTGSYSATANQPIRNKHTLYMKPIFKTYMSPYVVTYIIIYGDHI